MGVEMRNKIKKGQLLKDWEQLDNNLYFFKDKEGTVWQLLRTPYKEIPVTTLKFNHSKYL